MASGAVWVRYWERTVRAVAGAVRAGAFAGGVRGRAAVEAVQAAACERVGTFAVRQADRASE